jgi:hypothetical protein
MKFEYEELDKETLDKLADYGIFISRNAPTLNKEKALVLLGEAILDKFVREFVSLWKNELFPNCRLQDFEASEEKKQNILAEDAEHDRNSDPTGQDSDRFCRQAERTTKSVSCCDVLTEVRESGKLTGQPIFIYGSSTGGYSSVPEKTGKYGQRLPAYVRNYQLTNTAMSCRRGKRKLSGVYRRFWKKSNKPQYLSPKLKILEPYRKRNSGNSYGHRSVLYKSLESYLS